MANPTTIVEYQGRVYQIAYGGAFKEEDIVIDITILPEEIQRAIAVMRLAIPQGAECEDLKVRGLGRVTSFNNSVTYFDIEGEIEEEA